jgi:hypothetical protein
MLKPTRAQSGTVPDAAWTKLIRFAVKTWSPTWPGDAGSLMISSLDAPRHISADIGFDRVQQICVSARMMRRAAPRDG